MSKKGSRPEDANQVPDLSALDFGPSWAQPDKGNKSRKSEQGKPARDHQQSRGQETKGRDQGAGRGNQGKNQRGNQGGGHSGHDRRDDRRGGQRQGRDRRDFSKAGRDSRPVVAAPEGIKARIMPIEAGMDALAKQISATGRTHSVFDLAWLVLGGLDRFHVIFESEQQPLYRSKGDHSVWLSQTDCLSHMWSSGRINEYYKEEITEVDPPSGNFQSVARCGLSGKLIGPPNHHSYQQVLIELHRERFGNMSIEHYKAKIVMQHGEEAVQEWVDAIRQHKRWRPIVRQAEKIESIEEEPAEEEPAEEGPVGVEAQQAVQAAELEAKEGPAAELEPEAATAEDLAEDAPSDSAEAEVEGEQAEAEQAEVDQTQADQAKQPSPVIEETVPILDNRREVEAHFLAHGFEQEFDINNTVSALANIPSRMISPGLMALLKNTVADEKRYPGKLASILCRQMSGRHLAVYKWKKRLHCGPARPRHVPGGMVMADRPDKLFHWVMDHPGGNIDEMWKDCLPAEIDDDTRHTWYHDLHWLINEGLLLLFSDGTLHAAKELEKKAVKKTAKKAAKKATKKTDEKTDEKAVADVPDQVVAQSEVKSEAQPEAESQANPEAEPAQDEAPADTPTSEQ